VKRTTLGSQRRAEVAGRVGGFGVGGVEAVTNLALASGLQDLRHVKLGAQLYITSQALFTPSLLSLVFCNIRRCISKL
jgi:hypothetical protein